MRFSSAASLTLAGLAGSALAAPYQIPTADGFPNPSSGQLAAIEKAAGGSLPNGALPTQLTPGAVVTLQLIALNELFETAFFSSLYNNITDGTYDVSGYDKSYLEKVILTIQKQEELHALGANGILKSAGAETIQPCKYQFPVSSFKSAIALANTFTDVVLSVLPLAQTTFATDGGDETGLVQLVGSIIAQEAEQNGWYRYAQGKVPSAAPFLTTSGPAFAWTFLQTAIVPGSCPNADNVKNNIPTFKALNVVSGAKDYDSTVTYSVSGSVDSDNYAVVYLSGQNLPLTVPIEGASSSNGGTTFKASLPFTSEGFAQGLTVAAVVKGTGNFSTAADVAAATVYGPGIIEIN